MTIAACLIATILALPAQARAADDISVSILYYEPVRFSESFPHGKALATGAETAPLIFDAYGRRFELQPEESRPLYQPELTQLRGHLAGLNGSWFSLLRNGDELSGIIADGEDIYLIEPRHRIAALLIDPDDGNATDNLIFRLADTLIPQGLIACATTDNSATASAYINGKSAATALGAELQSVSSTASATVRLPLLVGVIADESFYELHATETPNEVSAIFNTVQGILMNEIGLELVLDSVWSVTPDIIDKPFSDTVISADLLDEVGAWRSTHQEHLGHTHLLTRKRLVNDLGDHLAGISYLGVPKRTGVCEPRTGASISRDIRGLTALVVTHELGHNLGAPHDGDPGGACASASATEFIMSTKISTRTAVKFSDCSISQIDKFIEAASCLNESAETLPGTSESGGGGGTLDWLAMTGLFCGLILRRRRLAGSIDRARQSRQ